MGNKESIQIKSTRTIGREVERIALNFLEREGLKLLSSNFHTRYGEIDLIMRSEKTLVFVEVRYRKQSAFGGAIYSITENKQQKLRKAASAYLQQNYSKVPPCRFDAICISGVSPSLNINWLRNAF